MPPHNNIRELFSGDPIPNALPIKIIATIKCNATHCEQCQHCKFGSNTFLGESPTLPIYIPRLAIDFDSETIICLSYTP
jgi:hypothetical protein